MKKIFLIILAVCFAGTALYSQSAADSLLNFILKNKDTIALQIKLNELIASSKDASNRLIDVEDLTPEELEILKKFYVQLAKLAAKETDFKTTHSIEEAAVRHKMKMKPIDKKS